MARLPEFGKLTEARFATFSREIAQMMDSAAKSAPAGTEPVLAAIKQAMAATTAMVDTLDKTAKQLAEVADANLRSATNAAKGGT